MGIFDLFLKNRPKVNPNRYEGEFKLFNGYVPKFTTYEGGMDEDQRIRAAIHARATHVSKLKVEMQGSALPVLRSRLQHAPNQLQTWSQFMYRLSTILDIHNTAFIVPIYNEFGEITGVFNPLPSQCTLVQYNKVPYLKYDFAFGQSASIELKYCGVLTKFQHSSDLFGDDNRALNEVMDLIHINSQGIQEGVKSAATYRFMASVTNFSKTADLAKERKEFSEKNFSRDAGAGGLLLFPNTYKDIKQIDVKPWVVDAEQLDIINKSIYEYFGVNEDVLTNKAYGDSWTAFYEGAIEPFAIQFSEVLTKMLYTLREQSQGNCVIATANRLQYLSNAEKLNVSTQLLDRGILSINQVLEIWNLPPVEGGDKRIIRGEYYEADRKLSEDNNNE